MSAVEELNRIPEKVSNKYIENWKEDGKKVIGFTCSFLPEEIIHAAGMIPYRLRGVGCDDFTLADSYLSQVNCTFVRACLQLGLSGEYDFLDGAIISNGCDHIRRIYDNWKVHKTSPSFLDVFPVSHMVTDEGMEWYIREAKCFMESLEELSGPISDSNLSQSIDVYEEGQKLLEKLYELRKREDPPVNGSEAMGIVLASGCMPREEYNSLLKDAIAEIESRDSSKDFAARLMIAGSVLDTPDLISITEEFGGVVVADSLCFGARSFLGAYEKKDNPLETIIHHRYHNILCPRMFGEYSRRLDYIMDTARDANVDGIILQHIKFCDLHATDNFMLKDDLEDKGIPVLELDRQYGPLADIGRIRTRVQAFMERIERRTDET